MGEVTWEQLGREFWQLVNSPELGAGGTCRLLAEALAFGLNEGDFAPDSINKLIAERFDELHIAKHLGKPQ